MRAATGIAVLALALVAPAAAACAGVPCGYVYPLIRMEVDTTQAPWPLLQAETLEIPAKVVFQFDPGNEGMGPEEPGRPIVITFEYPRKPQWVEIVAEPENIPVPISPQYLRPDASDPNAVKLLYVYESDVVFRLKITGPPVLRQGQEFQKLLVFAKSTESGLYKPAYGIKELRVVPEGATYVAATSPSAAVDAPGAPLAPVEAVLGESRLRVTPAADRADPWKPAAFHLAVDPAGPATLQASLVDEEARVLYTTGPRLAHDGQLTLNVTLPGPGLHFLVAHARPAPGSAAFAPQTVAVPLRAGDAAGAFRMPPEYKAQWTEPLPELRGDVQDPAAQFEKFLPFPVESGASSGNLAVVLRTTGPVPLDGGAANVGVQVLDPNGAVVAQGSADALNPVKSVAVSGFPGTGLFQIRLFGAGANLRGLEGAAVDLALTVQYDGRPVVETAHDGRLDAPTAASAYGRLNATLAAPAVLPLWEPAELAPDLAFSGSPAVGYAAHFALHDADGRLLQATPLAPDSLAATVSPPAPGPLLALWHVASADADWQTTPLAFLVHAGERGAASWTTPAAWRHAGDVPADGPLPYGRPVAVVALPVHAGGSAALDVTGGRVALRGPDGAPVEAPGAPGLYTAEIWTDGGPVAWTLAVDHPQPLVLENPAAAAPDAVEGRPVPGAGLLALGLGVVGFALARRR